MKLTPVLAIAAMAMLTALPAFAAPPTVVPSAPPVATKATPAPTVGQQIDALQKHDAAVTAQLNIVARNYQSFAITVYAPYCKDGVVGVRLIKPLTAWPAAVWCKGMDLKKPGLMAEGPKP